MSSLLAFSKKVFSVKLQANNLLSISNADSKDDSKNELGHLFIKDRTEMFNEIFA
jgi:hypothetical protein